MFVGICWGKRETVENWQRQNGCKSEGPDPGNTGPSSANGQGKIWSVKHMVKVWGK